MSDYDIDDNQQDGAPNTKDQTKSQRNHHEEPRMVAILTDLLDRGDSLVYAVVGICFFLAGFFALGYSFWDFITSLQKSTAPGDIGTTIIKLVSDLLLVLIIMEVLSTVIHYLKSHATSLRPFLYIGIVSATRGILSIGARLSVNVLQGSAFTDAMIELGINAVVVLILGITLKLLGKLADD